jgi:ABC-type glycerol-3-phosphate transport system permease component
MPQCTSATFSGERHARPDRPPPSIDRWMQLMAGALLGSIPVALIHSFFVKYYIAGLTAGAVKG